ncbi:MAG: GGDEF domain-containing protein, partial [Burkholderiaceae bacterium]
DLDGFKRVNDRHGHAAGDAVLKAAAERLRSCVRSSDTLCRLGGDEFVVLMEQTDAAQAAEQLARVHQSLAQAYPIAGKRVKVQASIGVAIYPDDAKGAQSLIRASDLAMYKEKARHKSPQRGVDRSSADLLRPTAMLTIEAAAYQLCLSRPHVLKLIAEKRIGHVVSVDGGLPMIPADEVARIARETW